MVILPSLPPVQLTESTDMIKGHCEKHCTETKNITKNSSRFPILNFYLIKLTDKHTKTFLILCFLSSLKSYF